MYFPQTKCQETCLQKPNCIHRVSLSLTLYSSLGEPGTPDLARAERSPDGGSGPGERVRARGGGAVRGERGRMQQVSWRHAGTELSTSAAQQLTQAEQGPAQARSAPPPAWPAHRGQALQLYHSSSES